MTDEQPLPPGYVPYEMATGAAPPVSRGRMFGNVLWRSTVLGALMLAAIGGGLGVVAAITDRQITTLVLSPLFAMLGVIAGGYLGTIVGVVLGGLAAMLLIPYRGRGYTVRFARIGALGAVALFCIPFLRALSADYWAVPTVSIGVTVIGAAVFSPYLVNWYVRDQEPDDTNAPDAPPPV